VGETVEREIRPQLYVAYSESVCDDEERFREGFGSFDQVEVLRK
jgi:hypothetical protein